MELLILSGKTYQLLRALLDLKNFDIIEPKEGIMQISYKNGMVNSSILVI
jgi:hypothetical protein